MEHRFEMLEKRVELLELKLKSGRPPTRLNDAKEYLNKKLSKGPIKVSEVVNGSGFSQQLLSKARKEEKYEVWSDGGIWYWGSTKRADNKSNDDSSTSSN